MSVCTCSCVSAPVSFLLGCAGERARSYMCAPCDRERWFLVKKQFVSELELISQLSVPNAVIGPISLCFLQLASLNHCGEKRGERARKSEGETERDEGEVGGRRWEGSGGGTGRVTYL